MRHEKASSSVELADAMEPSPVPEAKASLPGAEITVAGTGRVTVRKIAMLRPLHAQNACASAEGGWADAHSTRILPSRRWRVRRPHGRACAPHRAHAQYKEGPGGRRRERCGQPRDSEQVLARWREAHTDTPPPHRHGGPTLVCARRRGPRRTTSASCFSGPPRRCSGGRTRAEPVSGGCGPPRVSGQVRAGRAEAPHAVCAAASSAPVL